MSLFALLFTLSAIGISETKYLIDKRRTGSEVICVVGEDCEMVLESKYNKFLGIRNDVWGLVFYIAMAMLSGLVVLEWFNRDILALIFKGLVIIAGIVSLFLVYIQWKVIRKWCFWCLMSAGTVFLMLIVVFMSFI